MSSEEPEPYGFNFWVGVMNGALFMFGVAFMSPTTVLPHFINNFTDSRVIVGMSSFLHVGCWCLPQVFAAAWVERFPRKKKLYLIGSLGRLSFTCTGIWCIGCYGLGMVMGGLAGLCFLDMIAGVIPAHRRAAFFSARFIAGGCFMTLIAGFVVRSVLNQSDGFDMNNYLFLFSLGIGLMGAGMSVMFLIRERPVEVPEQRRSIFSGLMNAPALLKSDSRLRRLLTCRLLSMFSRMCWPFFIILATDELGLGESFVGLSMIVQTTGAFLGNISSVLLSNRLGNRVIIRACSVLEFLTALYAGIAGAWLLNPAQPLDPENVKLIILPTFFLMGLAWHASFVGSASYLLDFAPEERRPTYLGILNTAMGLGTFAPAFAGFISGPIGLVGVFFLSATFGVASFWNSLKLESG
jgi:MFS family permease